MQPHKLLFVLIIAACLSSSLPAQDYPRYPPAGSIYVPLDSWVYPALDRLAAMQYVSTEMLGLRPWTRAECSRLVDEASEHLNENSSAPPEAMRLFRSLQVEFAPELEVLGGAHNRSLGVESLYLRFVGISGTPLRDSFHFGQTIINDFGRPFGEGANFQAGFSGWATSGRFALYLRGEYHHAPSAPALSEAIRNLIAQVDQNPVQPASPVPAIDQFRLLDSYGLVNLANWEISFGKQSLWWGPGNSGPLIWSDNAEPVVMGRISRTIPFRAPSLLGSLGPIRMEAFFGKLAGHKFPAAPFIQGQKISFKPSSRLEIGLSRTVVFAGAGHPLTFGSFWRASSTMAPGQADPKGPDPGDRRIQLEFSYRAKNWFTIYNSFMWDDAIRRTTFNPGVYLPRIPGVPKLDLRAEVVSTNVHPDHGNRDQGRLIYFNGVYHDSYQNKGFLLGNWVGRQGRGVQVWSTYWLSPERPIQASYRHGWVNPQFIPQGGSLNDIGVRADWLTRADLSVSTYVQYENWTFPVFSPTTETNLTTSFQLTFRPQSKLRWEHEAMVSPSNPAPTWTQGQRQSSTEGSRQVSVNAADEKAPKTEDQNTAMGRPQGMEGRYTNSLGRPLAKNILLDQKAIWISPSRLRLRDATWLVPLGGLTAGLLATDSDVARHLSNSPDRLHTSRQLSNFGAASLVGAAGGLYLWGKISQDDHRRETGLLSGEALINSLAFSQAIKFSTGRERPRGDNAQGTFGQGGTSFPSDHGVAAWSVASVIAHEYPGPLTKFLAYGLASAVSASRVTAKEHFPSDVLVGSAIGWFVGQQVYRAHHNPELGGGSWDTLSEASYAESSRKPGNMGSPYVPLDSWVYPAFDRLAALGYLHTDFEGMRPWTRLECGRLVEEAGEHISEEESDPPEVNRLYGALEREFAGDLKLLGGGSNQNVRLESIYTRFTGIAGKPLRDSYHFAQTIINDHGRPYAEGANNVTGFSGWASAGPFTAYIRGEYQHAPSASLLSDQARQVIAQVDFLPFAPPSTTSPSVDRFRLLDSYVAMSLENWQVSFGKQSLWWGPGRGGPMMFSDNAEPIDMFRVNRVTPLKLPNIFGWLGPMRTEFFLGQLSGYEFVLSPSGLVGQFGHSLDPQPFIHGQKISFEPKPNFEFGLFRTTIYGGPGFPLTLHTLARSLFSTGNELAGNPKKPGDRRSGVDFTYRIPKLRKWLTFYGDGFTDDEFSPIGYFDRSVWHAGIYVPQIPRLHTLDLRVEGVYTDNPLGGNLGHGFYYQNRTWKSGYRNGGSLIGSWIGREGQGAQAWTTYWLSPRNKIQLSYRHQKVSQEFIPDGGTLNDAGVQVDLWVRSDLGLSSFVQYEKWNFPVLASRAQSNLTTSLQFTFWPHRGK